MQCVPSAVVRCLLAFHHRVALPHGLFVSYLAPRAPSHPKPACADAVVEVPVPALGDSIAEGTVAGILKGAVMCCVLVVL